MKKPVIQLDDHEMHQTSFKAGETERHEFNLEKVRSDLYPRTFKRYIDGEYIDSTITEDLDIWMRRTNYFVLTVGSVNYTWTNISTGEKGQASNSGGAITASNDENGHNHFPINAIVEREYTTDAELYCFYPKTNTPYIFYTHQISEEGTKLLYPGGTFFCAKGTIKIEDSVMSERTFHNSIGPCTAYSPDNAILVYYRVDG
jgi:hypothetical protein